MNSWNEIEGEIEAAEIVMIAELPVLQLKHVQSALLPQEGCWKWIEGCRVEAVVTVSVNMKQQAVTSMTLVEVLKKDQLVERINAQNLKPLQMSIVWETDSERDAGQSL